MVNKEKKANQEPNPDEEKTSENSGEEKTSKNSDDGGTGEVDKEDFIHPNRFQHEKKKRKEMEEKVKDLREKVGADKETSDNSSDEELIDRADELAVLQDYSKDERETLKKFKKAGNYSSFNEAVEDEDFQVLIEAKRKKEESNKSPKPDTGELGEKDVSELKEGELKNASKAEKEELFKELGLYD